METKEEKISSKSVFDGKVVKLFCDEVKLPNGNIKTREVLRHRGAVAVVAIIDGNLLMVKQFRYPFDREILEIPAGKLENNEEPYDAAIRELEEETGYKATKLVYMGSIFSSVAYTDECIRTFYAEDLKKTKMHLDDDEFLNVLFIPFNEVLDMVLSDKIKDAKTVSAVLRYYMIKNK